MSVDAMPAGPSVAVSLPWADKHLATRLRPVRVRAWMRIAVVAILVALAIPTAAIAKYAAIVMDADTGRILHAVNEDERNFPASLTKMMTLYVAFDAINAGRLRLNDRVEISTRAAAQAPSKIGLPPGATIRAEDAILALVTKSANDISVALAEHIGGNEATFVDMMNQRARQLGMASTTFRNPHGLPNPDQRSTARDLALLSRALIHNHGRHYAYFSREEFAFNGSTHANHNRLMARFEGMDGIKTGFIRASGFNLAASAVRDGRRLIGVVMGGESARSRDDHMADLLERAFARRGFQDAPVLSAGSPPASGVKRASTPAVKQEPARKPAAPAQATRRPGSGTTAEAAASASGGESLDRLVARAASPPPPRAALLEQGDATPGWAIQVGVFGNQTASRRAATEAVRRLPSLLGDADIQVTAIGSGKQQLFRSRLTGLDEREARQACRSLTQSGGDCMLVAPPTRKL
jgi:D-alanyl-D-alanine carboxypeptidase